MSDRKTKVHTMTPSDRAAHHVYISATDYQRIQQVKQKLEVNTRLIVRFYSCYRSRG